MVVCARSESVIKGEKTSNNVPIHPEVDELAGGDTKVMFFPPKVTPLLQPTDKAFYKILNDYRCQVLSNVIEDEGENDIVQLLKPFNVKPVIYMITSS